MPKFKVIPGYPEYRVGSDGSVWSKWSWKGEGFRSGFTLYSSNRWRKLKPRLEKSGYSGVTLCDGTKGRKCFRVHQLVMLAFVGPPPPGMEVLHINGDKSDSRLSNLRYGTKKENALDAIRHGKRVIQAGEDHPLHKMTDELVRSMRQEHIKGKKGFGAISLSKKYGISKTVTSLILRGERWKHVQ